MRRAGMPHKVNIRMSQVNIKNVAFKHIYSEKIPREPNPMYSCIPMYSLYNPTHNHFISRKISVDHDNHLTLWRVQRPDSTGDSSHSYILPPYPPRPASTSY